MTPWKSIEDLDRRVRAIENYLNAHKFEALVPKKKAPELPQEPELSAEFCEWYAKNPP